jgi:hypothetical protein
MDMRGLHCNGNGESVADRGGIGLTCANKVPQPDLASAPLVEEQRAPIEKRTAVGRSEKVPDFCILPLSRYDLGSDRYGARVDPTRPV